MSIKKMVNDRIIKALGSGTNVPQDPTQPHVLPPDAPVFSVEIENKISEHEDEILHVQDFASFLELLNKLAIELNLNIAQDLLPLAGYLNRLRVDNGLEPL